MKRYLALMLMLAILTSLSACGTQMHVQADDECCDGTADSETTENTDNKSENKSTEKWDLIPMVRVNGVLYLDTGYESTLDARCGVMDGEITSQVDGSEMPTEDDQSNFGTGYGYQYGTEEGTVELYMNEQWRVFATEEARRKIQFPDEPQQENNTDIQDDGLCGYPTAEDMKN